MNKPKYLIIAVMTALLLSIAQPVHAESQPQLILLYSEVNEQYIYNTYWLKCDIEGDITIDVHFTLGGTYATTARCGYRITTPGSISLVYLEVLATGAEYGPIVPVGIDEQPAVVYQVFLPAVTR